MKPRKTDLSVQGRLGESGSSARSRSTYGMDRLGITRPAFDDDEDDSILSAGPDVDAPAAQTPASEVSAAATQESAYSVAPMDQAYAAYQGAAPQDAPSPDLASTSICGVSRRTFRLGLIALAVAAALTTIVLVRMYSATPEASQASAVAPAVVPIAVPAVVPAPKVAAKHFNLLPVVRSAAADLTAAIEIAQAQGRQSSRDLKRWLAGGKPSALKTEPALANIDGPKIVTVKDSPATRPAPAIRYRDCPSGLTMSGVIRTPDGAFASINGKMVKVGGTVNSAKLISIGDFSVEMEIDGERFILGIGQDAPEPEATDESATDEPAPEPATKPAKPPPAKTTPAKSTKRRPAAPPADEQSPEVAG